MGLFKKSGGPSGVPRAGSGYVVLNIIRAFNIIALLAVMAASVVMLVKTFVVSKFFFFDGVSHIITAFLALFLIITETSLLKTYIATNWPLLSPTSGFLTLGFLMIILGSSMLGQLNKTATSEKSIGAPAWRLIISSGILALIFGVVNLFASYIYRQKSLGITARMVRAHGAVAPQKTLSYSPSTATTATPRGRKSFHLGRRSASDSLPSYYTRERRETRNISAPVVGDQSQFEKFNRSEEIQRPDLAMHPALNGGRF